MTTPRLTRLPALAVALLAGCIAEPLIDAYDYDVDSRGKMVRVGGDEAFSFFAPPGLPVALDLDDETAFMHRVLEHLEQRLGGGQPMAVSIYLRPADAFDDEIFRFAGVASCEDRSFDLLLDGAPLARLRSTAAHELAHLVICARVGSSVRVVLNEGLAEYLANTYVEPEPSSDFAPPRSSAVFFSEMMCDTDWSLARLMPNAGWYQRIEQIDAYSVAALLTEVAVARIGLRSYIERVFLPASWGTTGDVERLLVRELGLDLKQLEQAMRQAAYDDGLNICDADAGAGWGGCPGACRCVPNAELSDQHYANDRCVPLGVAP